MQFWIESIRILISLFFATLNASYLVFSLLGIFVFKIKMFSFLSSSLYNQNMNEIQYQRYTFVTCIWIHSGFINIRVNVFNSCEFIHFNSIF